MTNWFIKDETIGWTWFVASRVEESTGINIDVYSGVNWWYSKYSNYNFTRGEEPKEKSIICFAGDGEVDSYGYINTWRHVAIIEKIEATSMLGGLDAGMCQDR